MVAWQINEDGIYFKGVECGKGICRGKLRPFVANLKTLTTIDRKCPKCGRHVQITVHPETITEATKAPQLTYKFF